MKRTLFLSALFVALSSQVGSASPGSSLTLRVHPERDAVCRGDAREIVVQVEVEGKKITTARRTPMNLALVLDRSGSMTGAKLEKARQAACMVVDQLTDDDSLTVVIYHNNAEVLIPMQRLGDGVSREGWKKRINQIQPGGGTALYAGVSLGGTQLSKELGGEKVSRVILLSDGLANVGPQSTPELVKLGRGLRERGMSVSTVGLGDDYNEDLMTALAESSRANYYYVKDAEKLPGIFSEELGSVRTVLARGVKIRIEVPEGVQVKEIIGHPEIHCTGKAVEIATPEYFSSDRQQYLARCVVTKAAEEKLQVAQVALAYTDTDSGKPENLQQAVAVKVVDEEKDSTASIHPEVASNLSAVQNRVDKEAAVALADKGQAKDAAELLKRRIAENVAKPKEQQMSGVDDENKKLSQTVWELENRGQLEKGTRKQVQYDNWKGRYQKEAPQSANR